MSCITSWDYRYFRPREETKQNSQRPFTAQRGPRNETVIAGTVHHRNPWGGAVGAESAAGPPDITRGNDLRENCTRGQRAHVKAGRNGDMVSSRQHVSLPAAKRTRALAILQEPMMWEDKETNDRGLVGAGQYACVYRVHQAGTGARYEGGRRAIMGRERREA